MVNSVRFSEFQDTFQKVFNTIQIHLDLMISLFYKQKIGRKGIWNGIEFSRYDTEPFAKYADICDTRKKVYDTFSI